MVTNNSIIYVSNHSTLSSGLFNVAATVVVSYDVIEVDDYWSS